MSQKRKRKKTDRLGNRESTSTYDDYIEQLISNQSPSNGNEDVDTITLTDDPPTLVENSNLNETINPSANSNSNEIIDLNMVFKVVQTALEKIVFLQKHIATLDDHIIKLDIRINNSRGHFSKSSKKQRNSLQIVEMPQLKPFGIPVETLLALDNLETKLKDDDEWRLKLVSIQ